MSKLTAKDFVELYKAVYEVLPNPQRIPFPGQSALVILYNGLGPVVGFSRFSKETFEELCGYAIKECKFMPAPSWFDEKASQLSAPGRQVMTTESLLAIAPAAEPDNPEAQARIRLLIEAAEAKVIADRKDKEDRAKALVFPGGCDPKFTAWIEANLPQLRVRFPKIARRGGVNRDRLIFCFQQEMPSRLAYIEYCDSGPMDMRSACPNAQSPDYQPQRQLAAH